MIFLEPAHAAPERNPPHSRYQQKRALGDSLEDVGVWVLMGLVWLPALAVLAERRQTTVRLPRMGGRVVWL